MLKLHRYVITQLQDYIKQLGFNPLLHFELEGCYQAASDHPGINYSLINQQLQQLNIDGEVIAEYWHRQWEYVSQLAGQSPLKEADNLSRALVHLPKLMKLQGASKTLIKPVVWSGDSGKLALGSKNIFTNDNRAVHIPNAIQLNISALDDDGNNLVANADFGECLQQCFINTSLACCLLYLPEQEAFERFALKTTYGLADELCSPNDISGGHQGSVALYRKLGKHNQKMGQEPLLYSDDEQVLLAAHNWQKTARVEHRLGAASMAYDPYINIIYGLLNLIDALHLYLVESLDNRTGKSLTQLDKHLVQQNLPLPESLYDNDNGLGAISLFAQDTWFSQSIDAIVKAESDFMHSTQATIGQQIKQALLAKYQQPVIVR